METIAATKLDLTEDEHELLGYLVDYDLAIAISYIGGSYVAARQKIAAACERNGMDERRLLFAFRMERAGHVWPPPTVEPARSVQWNYGGLPVAVMARDGDIAASGEDEMKQSSNGSAAVVGKLREAREWNGYKMKYSDDDIRRLHKDYLESGDAMRVVAKRCRVSTATLSSRFAALGLPVRSHGGKRPVAAKAEIPAKAAIVETAVIPAPPQQPVATPDPAGLTTFLREARALGVQVEVTGEVTIKLRFGSHD